MRRLLLLGLLGMWPSTASAASLTWERGAGADSCAEPAKVEVEVERQLGKPLASVRPRQRARVELYRSGNSWVARLEMRDEQGNVAGQRTLSVTANNCNKLEQYTVIVLALTLDGGAQELAEEAPAATTPEPEQSSATFRAPEPVPEPPPAPAPPARATQQLPRLSGAGELCVFVQGPVYGPGSASAAVRADAQRFQSALAAELLRRALFTVVEVAPSFERELSLRSWLRRAPDLPAPTVALPAGSALPPLAQADYVLVPLIETLTVQDGLDYSLGSDPRAIVVNARVTLLGFDALARRELPPVALDASLAFAGNARNMAGVRLALRTALASIASDALKWLEREPEFASQMRAASARGARHGCAPTRSSDTGALPVQPAHGTWDVGFYLDAVKRLAYARPAESDLVRARATGLRAQELGPATELGLGVRLLRRTLDDSGWRPSVDVRAASIDTENAPLIVELQGGVGYELPLTPAASLALLPRMRGGVLLTTGTLGGQDRERGQLESLLGATLSLDLTLAFYGVIGNVSPFVTLGAQYVLPLRTDSQKSEFLDSELPRLHGAGLELGFLISGPRSAQP